jgi:small GTP-binding protein
MAMPHVVQMYIIKKRLKGRFGKARIKELNQILLELPGYRTGPYGEIRKWIAEEIEHSRTNSRTLCRDEFTVRREGESQIVLVGPPNIGKSSLLSALCGRQVKIANYAFTTVKPVPSVLLYSGIQIQLVEIPGLIEGASEDKGFGRRLIGVARSADAIIYIHDLTTEPKELELIACEIKKAGIEKPFIVVGSKTDLATEEQKRTAMEHFKGILLVSANTGEGLDELKEAIWLLTGLIRVYTMKNEKPVALEKGSNVLALAEKIHRNLAERVKAAKVTGASVKFPNQTVSLNHVLADNDSVELID